VQRCPLAAEGSQSVLWVYLLVSGFLKTRVPTKPHAIYRLTDHTVRNAEAHWTKVQWMLERNLFPWLGRRPILEISAPELLMTLRRIEGRGAIETTKRVKQVAGQAFRFAVATGRPQRDPAQYLRGALAPAVKNHLAAVTDLKAVGPLRQPHIVPPSSRADSNAARGHRQRGHVCHGFRAMARTIPDEVLGYRMDWIEH
jgi:hypothetical protein